ncbi:MAG: hypothetical protein ACKESB_02175 [Candidatus Hodgkinia cicadicola]
MFIPAIDVRGSRCVRSWCLEWWTTKFCALRRQPLLRAEFVHVVDSDEAVCGMLRNFSSIREIVEMPDCCV